MLNSSNHHQNCSFAERIVEYIYDEIGEKERASFENHLANCSACSDETAAFVNASLAVGAWREAEFARISTPQIVIPHEAGQKHSESVSASWLDNLRGFFKLSPSLGLTSAAMAALVICAGLVFFAVKFSGSPEVAGIGSDSVKPIISPTTEIIKKPVESAANTLPMPSNLNGDKPAPELKDAKTNPKAASDIVKAADTPKPKQVRANTETAVQNKTNDANKPSAKPAQNRSVPTLNNIEEDEDDSLRLADLFDEIDSEK